MLNLSMLLEHSARSHPTRDAVVMGETRLTYAEVDQLSNQVANLLVSRGVSPGDKVALSCPNLPWFPIAYYGILKAGATVVPLNVLLRPREVAYHLADAEARAFLCFDGTPEMPTGTIGHEAFLATPGCETFLAITTEPRTPSTVPGAESLALAAQEQPRTFTAVATSPTDTAVVLYSSGTTGQPKGAELTHANMVLNALAAVRLCGSSTELHDRALVALPLFHAFGQTMLMNAGFATAATLVMLPRFDAGQALALMEGEAISFFAGVPTMYWSLLNAIGPDTDVRAIADKLRLALSGGSPMPVEILTRVEERFGVSVHEGYGLSEASPMVLSEPTDAPPRLGSVGLPIWGVEVRLVDPEWNTLEGADVVGEIAVRGHNIMKGYYRRPEATAEVVRDGWFRTGDLARRDEDGWYYIVDRAKDLIIRGGYNVYPREIEEVLLTHPEVSLAAVIGVPHEEHGEEIKAFVIPTPDSTLDPDTLRAWCKEQFASYKYPRIIEVVDSLPMTSTGKIRKRDLAKREEPAA
ncbi:long-chain-fatty-acid--CoA ligase [Rhodococcus sp. 2H158]